MGALSASAERLKVRFGAEAQRADQVDRDGPRSPGWDVLRRRALAPRGSCHAAAEAVYCPYEPGVDADGVHRTSGVAGDFYDGRSCEDVTIVGRWRAAFMVAGGDDRAALQRRRRTRRARRPAAEPEGGGEAGTPPSSAVQRRGDRSVVGGVVRIDAERVRRTAREAGDGVRRRGGRPDADAAAVDAVAGDADVVGRRRSSRA